MPQLTLVAFWGDKPPAFQRYLAEIGGRIGASPLGARFTPYAPEQIHATIVGLERMENEPGCYNLNQFLTTGERRSMDLAAALGLARAWPRLTVRFGGFDPDDDRVTSFGQTPFVRSFQLRRKAGKVMLMGWLHADGDFRRAGELWRLRRRFAEEAAVRPKYWADHDFYLTLGTLTLPTDAAPSSAKPSAAEAFQATMRDYIAANPIDVIVSAADLAFVRYVDPALPLNGSSAYPVEEVGLDAQKLASLYTSRAGERIARGPQNI
ncbi:MAG: hypothetical protein KDD92_13540 [Caldilineaceae bacterium]|nr:hypothetical protein [Caldilineaceae bacterium]